MKTRTVMLVTDSAIDAELLHKLIGALSPQWAIEEADSQAEALHSLSVWPPPDAILCAAKLPDGLVRDFYAHLPASCKGLPFATLAADGEDALTVGKVLERPFGLDDLAIALGGVAVP